MDLRFARPATTTRPSGKKHPKAVIKTDNRKVKVTFTFGSTEANSTFRCSLDNKPFRPCHSPQTYKVGAGKHSFRVVAVDESGAQDKTPAFEAFRIKFTQTR